MMNIEIFTALMVFAFVSSITPGPNNLMLMNSGANYGFKRTVPHVLGVNIGFTLMVLLVGLGIMQMFERYPVSFDVLKVLSIGYLLFLAYKIATTQTDFDTRSSQGNPMSFMQALLFQWVNPKAWTMSLTAVSAYAAADNLNSILIVSIVFGVINLPCLGSWIVLGQKIKVLLSSPKQLRMFNYAMALLLVGSLYPVVFPG